MFSNNRNELRQFFFTAWQKHLNQQLLEPLEADIVKVILLHPEYKEVFSNLDTLDRDFNDTNPFLHLSLHLALHDQIKTDRPYGIKKVYLSLCEKLQDSHLAEHRMMRCLEQTISDAQLTKAMPEEKVYLENLKKI